MQRAKIQSFLWQKWILTSNESDAFMTDCSGKLAVTATVFMALLKTLSNKHSVSIAKAIHVPYRPQQIFKRHNSYNSRSKGPESNFKSINQNMTEKSLGNIRKTKFLQRALTPVKVGQAWQNSNLMCIKSKAIYIQNWCVSSQKQFIYKILIEYLKRLQKKVRKTEIEQTAITPVKIVQAWRNSNLICFTSLQIHIPNFKSISQNTAEKSMEN